MPDLKIEVSEAQVQNAIAVAIAESFTAERRDSLLRDVVRAHLSQRVDTYSKDTLLSKSVGDAIRAIAKESILARIDELKPQIYRIVQETLGAKFEVSVMMQLRDALTNKIVTRLSIAADISEQG